MVVACAQNAEKIHMYASLKWKPLGQRGAEKLQRELAGKVNFSNELK